MLHLLLALLLWQVPSEWSLLAADPTIAEIQIVERPSEPSDPRNMVRQTEPPPELLEQDSKEKARFMSERDQRVLQETRANRTGLTRNGQALPEDSWMRAMRTAPSAKQQKRLARSPDGYEPIQLPKPQDVPTAAFDDAPSSIGEVMPEDVSVGNFNALNTDRFKYYSFYARIEELVRFRWERHLQNTIDSFDRKFLLRVVGRRNWVTSIEFYLAPNGKFLSAHIFKESGLKPIDLAAVNAFREAGYFPNPPAEMVKDGVIKIQYSFNVKWNPGAMADAE